MAPKPGLSIDRLGSMRRDGSRAMVHTIDIRGAYNRLRNVIFTLLIGLVAIAPWVDIGGRPLMWFDLDKRAFSFFGLSLNAQDTWLLLPAIITFAAMLLFITAWKGRLWCGYACPQTVYLEAFFRPIERLIDGPKARREAIDQARWGPAKIVRRVLKQSVFGITALSISGMFVLLFLGRTGLSDAINNGIGAAPSAFVAWLLFGGLLWFNFGYFREQFCVVVCPYGRLQSLMTDSQTKTVWYDAKRGEPRGRSLPTEPTKKGDCVDCNLCVQACPTAIDIRNGLQMECIACTQCIDACDGVMEKLHRPKGLIRMMSENEVQGRPAQGIRPRLVLYSMVGVLGISGLSIGLFLQRPFEANLIRPPGIPFAVQESTIYNRIEIHLTNKLASPLTVAFDIQPSDSLTQPIAPMRVESTSGATATLMLRRPMGQPATTTIVIRANGYEKTLDVPILGPPGK